jgi:hypothetical protein
VTAFYRWPRSALEVPLQKSVWLFDGLMLAVEAQHVIGLRLAAVARGGTAAVLEARLMVTEKVAAAQEAAGMLALGASTEAMISFYRSKVQANVRRLAEHSSQANVRQLTEHPSLLRRTKQKLLNTALRLVMSRNRINEV